MSNSNQGSEISQVESLQRRFAQAPGLPFANLLPMELIAKLLDEADTAFYDRIYSPLVTLAMFLSQCQDADHSQRQAVARLIAHRATPTSRVLLQQGPMQRHASDCPRMFLPN